MARKKPPEKPMNEGFLSSAAQAIGTTLGQLAKKVGVAPPPMAVKARLKKAVKKMTPPRKKASIKKKAPAKRSK